ncbi:hypothetical protein BST27_06920 [Mycobacterium intermedium]|uniref:Uncharacterized protein n=1 Tax=Mycobacterium intermedium TaxID=28445 RepID=A0A1E3SIY9_MYCIE|nr:hypothetical protein [Mycobacterium intermedium]ODR02085.1 hypothetical protein BHQ20_06380 [Mycobacterium intermedium]OPE45555.1 hypothetical protein BV508_29205 [Mycobacterium intermedium]ORB09036.1 hypothetical protein BST27_06920 [Mycobacterium intermedium]
MRASSPRPAAARRAAKDFDKHVLRAVPAEIRWAFSPPRTWLMGVVANLILAAALLLVQPLTPQGRHHQHFDWVILVGAYFSSFILADVTTTNLLGADHHRVRQALSDGTPLWRVLLIKDLALLVLVGLPTLAAAAALTLWLESPGRLSVTVPNVAVPILSWLGIGNFISALYPVTAEPLYRRWRRRRDVRGTAIWTAALTLPYVLYFVADPMDSVEHQLLWTQLPAAIGPILGRDTKSLVHFGVALVVWVAGTVAAVLWARKRGVRSR